MQQVLSSSWDGRPFGHNRHGPKEGGGGVPLSGAGELHPHLTQCRLSQGLHPYQVASSHFATTDIGWNWGAVPLCVGGKGKERKSIYIALFCTKVHTKRPGMDHTVLPANNTMPAFPSWVFIRWHHHNNWGSRHPIAAYYSFIDPERIKGWVAWYWGELGFNLTQCGQSRGLPLYRVVS